MSTCLEKKIFFSSKKEREKINGSNHMRKTKLRQELPSKMLNTRLELLLRLLAERTIKWIF